MGGCAAGVLVCGKRGTQGVNLRGFLRQTRGQLREACVPLIEISSQSLDLPIDPLNIARSMFSATHARTNVIQLEGERGTVPLSGFVENTDAMHGFPVSFLGVVEALVGLLGASDPPGARPPP